MQVRQRNPLTALYRPFHRDSTRPLLINRVPSPPFKTTAVTQYPFTILPNLYWAAACLIKNQQGLFFQPYCTESCIAVLGRLEMPMGPYSLNISVSIIAFAPCANVLWIFRGGWKGGRKECSTTKYSRFELFPSPYPTCLLLDSNMGR